MTDAAATASELEAAPRKPSIFNDRRRLAMLMLGFASGLPFTVAGGTLAAWFTAKGISTATIGVLSWSALAYSFKFLWSPLLHKTAAPMFQRFGLRKGWFIPLLAIQVACFLLLSMLDPTNGGLLAIAGIAVVISFVSATFDIVLDAWRIETAKSKDDIDSFSALVQAGYRSAAFVGGAGALIMSDHMAWNGVLVVLAIVMGLAMTGALIAPEPPRPTVTVKEAAADALTAKRFDQTGRNVVVGLVALGWAWSFWTLGSFMIDALLHPETAKPGPFTLTMGPLIVAATVLGPAFGAIWLLWFRKPPVLAGEVQGAAEAKSPLPGWLQSASNGLFGAVIEPMVDLIERLRWVALLALSIILTYRFADNIWGSFAYPFYMGAANGALGHTATEVAFASKMIGVVAIIAGIALGGLLLKWMGRMPALVAAAALAAATNLLFADLAGGAAGMDAFLGLTHLDALFGAFGENAHRMARLTIAILGENLAIGFASVVYLAYLTSMINPKYAAVQAALLGSLTMLVGQLGRPWLGALIESEGFAYVFMLTAGLGLIPVVLSAAEWWRQSRLPKAVEAAPGAAE